MTIYLDHNASTPIAAEVVEAMQPYLRHGYGNPSSRHWASDGLQNALAKARLLAGKAPPSLGASPKPLTGRSPPKKKTTSQAEGEVVDDGEGDEE